MVRNGIGGDHCSGQCRDLLFHHYIEGAVIEQLEIEVHVVQGITAEAQLPVSYRQGDAVEAVSIRDGICPARSVINRDSRQGLSAGHIPDMSAEIYLPASSCPRITYFVGFIGKGDHHVLFCKEAFHPVVFLIA